MALLFARFYPTICPKGSAIPGVFEVGSFHTDVSLYDIDISYPKSVVADLQSEGKKVMCYISGGTSEDFRDDINLFPEEVQGGIVSFGEGDEARPAAAFLAPVLMPPHESCVLN